MLRVCTLYFCSDSGVESRKEPEVVQSVDIIVQERQQLMAEVDERKRKILRDVEVLYHMSVCHLLMTMLHVGESNGVI